MPIRNLVDLEDASTSQLVITNKNQSRHLRSEPIIPCRDKKSCSRNDYGLQILMNLFLMNMTKKSKGVGRLEDLFGRM
jgi:hypothetical protein